MTELRLVMPMAGRGSRFSLTGEHRPKPLIEIDGRPFFWWATESVRRAVPVSEMLFVVLEEHIAAHAIDRRIKEFYPQARILALPQPTAGAAETAALGIAALGRDGPFAVNDCDHAFTASALGGLVETLRGDCAGGLVGFRSDDPAYSYVRLAADDSGRVLATVEKQRVGPYAIAGCYLFRDRATFERGFSAYREACPYPELFLSGVYNLLIDAGATIRFAPLSSHLSFGTPEELARVAPGEVAVLIGEDVR